MGVVGIGVWRGAWSALAEDRRRPPSWMLALALAAGFLVGPQLALERAVRLEGDSTLLETAFGSGAPWIALLAVALVLVLAWVGASAESWIRARAGAERPARTTLAGLLVASGILAAFIAVFNYARDSRSLDRQVPGDRLSDRGRRRVGRPGMAVELVENAWLLSVLRVHVIILALVVLWLFPLAAWLRRRRDATDARVGVSRPGRTPPYACPGTRVASSRGSSASSQAPRVSALSFCFGPDGVQASKTRSTREDLGVAFAFVYWQYLIALGAQAAAGMSWPLHAHRSSGSCTRSQPRSRPA